MSADESSFPALQHKVSQRRHCLTFLQCSEVNFSVKSEPPPLPFQQQQQQQQNQTFVAEFCI